MNVSNNTCFLCHSQKTEDFFSLSQMPTQDGNLFFSQNEAESAPKGDIKLRFCHNCGYVENFGYEASKISFDKYDFSLNHSPVFADFVETLSGRLINQYDLQGKTILEVGCGDGYILKRITEKSNGKGIGVDPGFSPETQTDTIENIKFIKEYYSEKHAHLKIDFLICRLVIDLLEDPVRFMSMIRNNLRENPECVVYVEVPNAHTTFGDLVLWNVVYEHKSWFTPASLAYLFEICGFEVLNIAPCWRDEFLGIEARPRRSYFWENKSVKSDIEKFEVEIEKFKKQVDQIPDR